MYRISAILASWLPVIGWAQEYDSNGKIIEDSLAVSESGMTYQGEHPELNLKNLKAIADDTTNTNYPAWITGQPFIKGDIVIDDSVTYIAKQDNNSAKPVSSPNDWEKYHAFSSWLVKKTEAGIIETVAAYLENKTINRSASSLLENKTVIDGPGKIDNVIANESKRAGFEVVMKHSEHLLLKIDEIALQLNTIGVFNVYLHHTSQESVLKTLSVNYTKANSVQWFPAGWELPHVSADVDSGGTYYITYKQTELPGLAIKKDFNWLEPCFTCGTRANFQTWKIFSKFIEFHPFNVPEEAGNNIWDIDDNRQDYSNNMGMNFKISLYCDYTQFFIDQRDIFKSVLRKQVAMNLLRELVYNSNGQVTQKESRVSKAQLLFEIDGSPKDGITGMNGKYRRSMKAISLNTDGLNKDCLPCQDNGIRYGVI